MENGFHAAQSAAFLWKRPEREKEAFLRGYSDEMKEATRSYQNHDPKAFFCHA
jgi:hypothetical protein